MTNNKQKTAVEWLNEQLQNNVHHTIRIPLDIIQQAKEMEEGAIIVSWHKGYDNQSPMIDENNCGQQYYNETYGGDN
jgi:hypothetical protein